VLQQIDPRGRKEVDEAVLVALDAVDGRDLDAAQAGALVLLKLLGQLPLLRDVT
jgi:hypothetical protein